MSKESFINSGNWSGSLQQNRRNQNMAEDIMRRQREFEQWRMQESQRLEQKRLKLRTQKKQIEQERVQLDLEKKNFRHQQEFRENRRKNEEHLLDVKRQILEDELYKLAEEKKVFEQKKKTLYDQSRANQRERIRKIPSKMQGTIFFAGVNSCSALKKRYKDLLKIYHPDNKCGDTDTIQAINQEYERLLEQMQGST